MPAGGALKTSSTFPLAPACLFGSIIWLMVPSLDCLALIKRFEACRLEAYPDPTAAGGWAIGWGHTVGVVQGMFIDQERAHLYLAMDCAGVAALLNPWLPAHFLQCQYDALASITFNVGPGRPSTLKLPGRDGIIWLAGVPGQPQHSTLLARYIQQFRFPTMPYSWPEVADEFLRWNHVGGVVSPGLTRRRMAERALFLKGTDTRE